MPEISEGTEVITPEGRLGKLDSMIRDGKSVRVEVNEVGFQDDLIEDLVKVDQPLRVHVSRQCYAESLVALAEEHGFDPVGRDKRESPFTCDNLDGLVIRPDMMWYEGSPVFTNEDGSDFYDLTYAQDLPQIDAWLQANAESEDDECDKFGNYDRDEIIPGVETDTFQNESEELTESVREDVNKEVEANQKMNRQFKEPRPKDDIDYDDSHEWRISDCKDRMEGIRSMVTNMRSKAHPAPVWMKKWLEKIGDLTMLVDEKLDQLEETQRPEVIDDLKQQLFDCWENQKEYKNNVAELQGKVSFWKSECSNRGSIIYDLQNERAELRKRIEEVRDSMKRRKKEAIRNENYDLASSIRSFQEILSPDFDEGDGCSE